MIKTSQLTWISYSYKFPSLVIHLLIPSFSPFFVPHFASNLFSYRKYSHFLSLAFAFSVFTLFHPLFPTLPSLFFSYLVLLYSPLSCFSNSLHAPSTFLSLLSKLISLLGCCYFHLKTAQTFYLILFWGLYFCFSITI